MLIVNINRKDRLLTFRDKSSLNHYVGDTDTDKIEYKHKIKEPIQNILLHNDLMVLISLFHSVSKQLTSVIQAEDLVDMRRISVSKLR